MGEITQLQRRIPNVILLCFVVLWGALAACEKAEVAIIDGSTEVLDTPYPKQWAGSKSKTIAILSPGERVDIIGYEQGHDYIAYRVRLTDGKIGFLIGGDKFHLEPKNNRKRS